MEIYLEKENKTIQKELENPIELKKILKQLNISVESVILVKNDEITLEDEDVCNTDKIKILSINSTLKLLLSLYNINSNNRICFIIFETLITPCHNSNSS